MVSVVGSWERRLIWMSRSRRVPEERRMGLVALRKLSRGSAESRRSWRRASMRRMVERRWWSGAGLGRDRVVLRALRRASA